MGGGGLISVVVLGAVPVHAVNGLLGGLISGVVFRWDSSV